MSAREDEQGPFDEDASEPLVPDEESVVGEDEAADPTDEAGARTPAGARHGSAVTPSNSVMAWIFPPLLALGAVGVHFVLNVPDKPVVVDKEAEAKAKAKRRAERARKRRQRRMHQPRPGLELDTLVRRYQSTEFEQEPVVTKWARQTQTMLNKAIVMSRKAAFEGAPEQPRVSVVRTQCRTIRCRLVVRSPFVHELDLLAKTLRRVETLAGESIWRQFEVEMIEDPNAHKRRAAGRPSPKDPEADPRAEPEDAGDDEPPQDHYLQITVILIADNIDGDDLALGTPPAED